MKWLVQCMNRLGRCMAELIEGLKREAQVMAAMGLGARQEASSGLLGGGRGVGDARSMKRLTHSAKGLNFGQRMAGKRRCR